MDVTICDTKLDGIWLMASFGDENEVHIMPCNDLVKHQSDEACDGRERHERAA